MIIIGSFEGLQVSMAIRLLLVEVFLGIYCIQFLFNGLVRGFNEFLPMDEKVNGAMRLLSQVTDFGNALMNCRLLDIPMYRSLLT